MISIIILNYSAFEYTCQCIQSIYEQTKNVSFEIIIVDNASTDKNPDELLKIFPEIILVKNKENRGFSRGCNDGIARSHGDYILLLNSDTILLNDAISITYQFLQSHPGVGIATCRIENQDTSPQNNCQRFPSRILKTLELLRVHKFFPSHIRGKIWFGPYFNYKELAYTDWVWGTFFMFSKTLLNIYPDKKLPETFWMYIEDMEWCWLARQAGYKIAFVPDGRILHYGGGATQSEIAKRMIEKNFEVFNSIYCKKLEA